MIDPFLMDAPFLQVYVGRFIPRKEREMELGEKAKKFTNVFIKNFGEELTEQELTDMFAKFGKITSIKVNTCSSRGHGRVGGIAHHF